MREGCVGSREAWPAPKRARAGGWCAQQTGTCRTLWRVRMKVGRGASGRKMVGARAWSYRIAGPGAGLTSTLTISDQQGFRMI